MPAEQRFPTRRAPRRAGGRRVVAGRWQLVAARREQRVDGGLAEREVRAGDEAAVGLGGLRLERREQRGGAERGQAREQRPHQRRARLRLHERVQLRGFGFGFGFGFGCGFGLGFGFRLGFGFALTLTCVGGSGTERTRRRASWPAGKRSQSRATPLSVRALERLRPETPWLGLGSGFGLGLG